MEENNNAKEIGWLQISDLHFVDSDINNNIFKNAILNQCHDHMFQDKRVDFVIATGDFKNFKDNNFLSIDWIKKLMDENHLNLSIDSDLFLVPGNHDIDNTINETDKVLRNSIAVCLGMDLSQFNTNSKAKESYYSVLKDIGLSDDKCRNYLSVYQDVINTHKDFLLSLFSQYNNAASLINGYQRINQASETHIRTWKDDNNVSQINIIHLNTAIISNGKQDHYQITDVSRFSDILTDSSIDYKLPAIVIAHHSFYDLHPEIRKILVQLMNQANVVAWICGDAHKYNDKRDNIYISRKLPDEPNNTWPIIVCGKTAVDASDDWSDFGVQYYSWTDDVVKASRFEWEKDGNGIKLLPRPAISFTMTPRYNWNALQKSNKTKQVISSDSDVLIKTEKQAKTSSNYINLSNIDSFEIIDGVTISKETMHYIRSALGRESENKTDKEIVKQFLMLSNTIINGNFRYGIPEFAFDIPREERAADLYINNEITPLFSGTTTVYYRNQISRYQFRCQYIELNVFTINNAISGSTFGYCVHNTSSKERLVNLNKILKLVLCNSFNIYIQDYAIKNLFLSKEMPGIKWGLLENKDLLELWIEEITKITRIEQSYGITFNLTPIYNVEEIKTLYTAIDIVHDGLLMKPNGVFRFPLSFKIDNPIKKPTLWEDDVEIPLTSFNIYGISFVPRTSALLPGKLKKSFKHKIKTAQISILYAASINGELRFPFGLTDAKTADE